MDVKHHVYVYEGVQQSRGSLSMLNASISVAVCKPLMLSAAMSCKPLTLSAAMSCKPLTLSVATICETLTLLLYQLCKRHDWV